MSETEQMMRVHTLGTVAMTAAAWEPLIARGRTDCQHYVELGHGIPAATAYAAAKGAVLGFTRSLGLEADEVGVRVNTVMPMADRMLELAGGEVGSAQDRFMAAPFPPEVIAPTVVFLACDAVPYNGQVIEASGGTTAHVQFVVTPYLPATTPEEARDSLAGSLGGALHRPRADRHVGRQAVRVHGPQGGSECLPFLRGRAFVRVVRRGPEGGAAPLRRPSGLVGRTWIVLSDGQTGRE